MEDTDNFMAGENENCKSQLNEDADQKLRQCRLGVKNGLEMIS